MTDNDLSGTWQLRGKDVVTPSCITWLILTCRVTSISANRTALDHGHCGWGVLGHCGCEGGRRQRGWLVKQVCRESVTVLDKHQAGGSAQLLFFATKVFFLESVIPLSRQKHWKKVNCIENYHPDWLWEFLCQCKLCCELSLFWIWIRHFLCSLTIDRRAGAPTVVSHGEQGSCGQWQSVLALQTEAQFLLTSFT